MGASESAEAQSVDKNRFTNKATGSDRNLLWILGEHVKWQEQGRQLGILNKLENEQGKWNDLASEYVFISNLMEQMGTLGVETHKLSVRFQTLTKNMKACERPVEKQEMQKCLNMLKERLNVALKANDNVRAACQWLKAHWVMGMKRNELEAKIEKETTQLERLEIPGTPEMKVLEKNALKMQQDLNALLKCAEVHERRLLGVNLHYLDRNLSGAVEPCDMPNMPASLFNLLDQDLNHKVSADELDRTILRLDEDLAENTLTMRNLKNEQEKQEELMIELTAGKNLKDLSAAEQKKLETLEIKKIKTEEMLNVLEQQQSVLQDDKAAIYRVFTEEQGFVSDMKKKIDRVKHADLVTLLRNILKEPEIKTLRIGLADTDVKVRLQESIEPSGVYKSANAPVVPPTWAKEAKEELSEQKEAQQYEKASRGGAEKGAPPPAPPLMSVKDALLEADFD